MNRDAKDVMKLETEFLAGVETNFETAKGKQFAGTIWERAEADDEDRLRALMATHRNYDKSLLKSFPKNRRVAVHGFNRRFFLWKKRTGVAIASVLAPLEHYASGSTEPGPPMDLGDVMEHVRKLAGDRGVKHVIGVCSPTGFTEEARTARLEMPHAEIVLVEPDGQGGWRVHATSDDIPESVLNLFDAENSDQKTERVQEIIEAHSGELLTGGLTASAIARKVELPEALVRRAFEQVSAADPELRLSKKEGEAILFRGAPVTGKGRSSMSVIDRIRQLLSGDGDESEKINVLAERRATLAQRRDRIYEDIAKLEKREADLLSQGRAATSSVPKRRLAAQLGQARKDIARQNTTAAMLNKQIDIISTDIHNLTLIQQGEAAKLPDTLELTEHAVEAEEMLESLKADADLVTSLETGLEESLAGDEELAILKEFEQEVEPASNAPAHEPEKTSEPGIASSTPAADETPGTDKTKDKARGADPEPS